MVLFNAEAVGEPITKHYHAAAFTLRIAASVAAADGVICDNERTLLATQAKNWHVDQGTLAGHERQYKVSFDGVKWDFTS